MGDDRTLGTGQLVEKQAGDRHAETDTEDPLGLDRDREDKKEQQGDGLLRPEEAKEGENPENRGGSADNILEPADVEEEIHQSSQSVLPR